MRKRRALGAADAGAVGAGEAGQVADVDQVGDEHPVELALGHERRARRSPRPRIRPAAPSSRGEQLERLAVAVGALAGDLRQDQAVEDRDPAPVVARLDVGEVHLDRRQPGQLERVGDRAAVVGPGAGVDERRVGQLGRAVQVLDELALGVGLEEDRFEVRARAPSRSILRSSSLSESPP